MSSVAETTAEARLYEQHSGVVLRYCLRMLRSREDAEDAAQTTFFQAVRALRRGVVPTFEQAWLLTIAKNECLSRHRANGRRRRLELVRDPQTLEEIAEAPNGGDGTLIGVQSALGRLPETQRRALLLREWQGCSYAEIALELDTTLPAVEALLFRARRGLARELGEERKTRRHALDIASLLVALKSAFGGGVAVKAAAGLAAVATVGVVAGGAEQRTPVRASVVPAKQAVVTPVVAEAQTPAKPVSKPLVARRPDSQPGRAGTPKARADRAGIARPDEPASKPASGSAPANPSAPAPAAPRSDQVGPAPAPQAPVTAPVETPTPPPVPPLPEVPTVELPQLPVELPQLPEVQLPEVPLLPELDELPIVSDLPLVDDLPIVGDLLP